MSNQTTEKEQTPVEAEVPPISVSEPDFEPKVPGRKRTQLNLKLIGDFLDVGMPVSKIAKYFNCHPSYLYQMCGDLIAQRELQFEYTLREMQLAAARLGDVKMLIHLGKTVLKQTEAIPSVTEDGQPAQWNIVAPTKPQHDPIDEEEQ